MLRTVTRLSPSFIIPIIRDDRNAHDIDNINRPLSDSPQTGWDRVKEMYSSSEYEEISPELNTVFQSALGGAFFGACMGGFSSSRLAYLNFIENNQATIFKSTAEAKKKLQDYVTVAFAKGAYRWGWRLATFTGMFSLTATTISVYRGDTSLVQFVTAGALTGALYKFNLGFAAMIVGGGVGAALSLIAGLMMIGILKLTGAKMEDIRLALYKLREARKEQMDQALEKAAVEKHDTLTEHHKQLVIEKGERKIEQI